LEHIFSYSNRSYSNNTTVEINGVILLAFSNAAPSYLYRIANYRSGQMEQNSKVALGFAAHAGPNCRICRRNNKAAPSFTYPQQIGNTNDHTLRFSEYFKLMHNAKQPYYKYKK